MASSISKLFPSFKTVIICSAGGFFFGTAAHLPADLNSNTTPSQKRRNTTSGSSQPTAIAEATVAEVNRAGEVVIRLRGIARGGGRVEFMLMRKPFHGRIIQSKPVGLDCLDVTYLQSGDQRSDIDSFVFAVRAGPQGPFSPGEVKITIKDQPGRLLVPEELPYPATLIGKTASESFVIVNQGGESLSGKISVSPPWQLQETAIYQLAPGEKRRIKLLFNPEKNGPVEGRLTFEGTRPTSIQLRGEGIAPFLANPPKVILTPNPVGQRSGIISLQNNTDAALAIEIESPLSLPKTVSLQFGETRELPVQDDGIGLLNTFLVLKHEKYITRIEVTAAENTAPAHPVASLAPSPNETPAPSQTPLVVEQTAPLPPLEEELPNPSATSNPSLFAKSFTAKIDPLTDRSIRIQWQIPASAPAANYRIEQRYLSLDNQKKIVQQWVDVPSAQIDQQNHSATIDDLDARTNFTFRVTAPDSKGLTSLPLHYQTPPNFWQRLTWRSFLIPIGAVLIVLVAFNRWRQRVSIQ